MWLCPCFNSLYEILMSLRTLQNTLLLCFNSLYEIHRHRCEQPHGDIRGEVSILFMRFSTTVNSLMGIFRDVSILFMRFLRFTSLKAVSDGITVSILFMRFMLFSFSISSFKNSSFNSLYEIHAYHRCKCFISIPIVSILFMRFTSSRWLGTPLSASFQFSLWDSWRGVKTWLGASW